MKRDLAPDRVVELERRALAELHGTFWGSFWGLGPTVLFVAIATIVRAVAL